MRCMPVANISESLSSGSIVLVIFLAAGHVATEEDIYRGYRIPKGTIMIANMR